MSKREMIPAPKVTVITPTYNRPGYLAAAIGSVVGQHLEDWELLVVNDGGACVREVVEGFGDPRIRYLPREHNSGKAACLNYALERARGRYVAYLDDDDIWYPNHLEALAGALDRTGGATAFGQKAAGGTGSEVAYSDLYEVLCVKDSRGRRFPLQKRVRVCRDYNRMFMFHSNHVLHVSLMHVRGLARKVGGYSEDVRVLIDWNITRKMSFYTDFLHVPVVTGEYYVPVTDSDRISDLQRQDQESYLQNRRRIRADLPPEPWPRVRKVAVIYPVERWDEENLRVLTYLVDALEYPCRLVLVNLDAGRDERDCRRALGAIGELGNLRILSGGPGGATAFGQGAAGGSGVCEARPMAARSVEADFLYFPSPDLDRRVPMRLIRGLSYMRETGCDGVRWEADPAGDGLGDLMLTRHAFETCEHRAVPPPLSRKAPWGPDVHTIADDYLPHAIRTDYWLHFALECEREGDYANAERLMQRAGGVKQGGIGGAYLVQLYANIAFGLGRFRRAEEMCRELIEQGYGADNWIRLGEIYRRGGEHERAAEAYRKGIAALGLEDVDFRSDAFPIRAAGECKEIDFDAFVALVGLGECLVELGRCDQAAPCLRRAARLHPGSVRPSLAFGRLFLKLGDIDSAESAFRLASEQECSSTQAAEAQAGLAEVYERRKAPEPAWGAWLGALALDPENPDYIRQASSLGRRLGKGRELVDLLQRFLSYRPGDVAALRGLAEVYAELGQSEEAAKLADRAALLDHAQGEEQIPIPAGTSGLPQARRP